MFGIRTILLAIDLLRPLETVRDHAIRVAPIIHATDTTAATMTAGARTITARRADDYRHFGGKHVVVAGDAATHARLIIRSSS